MGNNPSAEVLRKASRKHPLSSHDIRKLWKRYVKGDGKMGRKQARSVLLDLGKALEIEQSDQELEELLDSILGSNEDAHLTYDRFKHLFVSALSLSAFERTKGRRALSHSLMFEVDKASRLPIFATPCEVAAERSDPMCLIPSPIRVCCDFLDREESLTTEGLYRVPGNNERLLELIDEFNAGRDVVFKRFEQEEAAGIVVRFLNMMPVSIFTPELEDMFYKIEHAAESEQQRLIQLKRLVSQLPLANRMTLQRIAQQMHNVAAHSDKNKMTVNNLAMVVGPNRFPAFKRMIEHAYNNKIFVDTVVFGVTIAESSRRSGGGIPAPLKVSVEFLNAQGIDDDLLYIQSGSMKKIKRYIYMFNGGNKVEYKKGDHHEAAGVVMSWFRDSKDSLLGDREEKTAILRVANEAVETSSEGKLVQLQVLMSRLPRVNLDIIAFFADHLHKIRTGRAANFKALLNRLGASFSIVFEAVLCDIEIFAWRTNRRSIAMLRPPEALTEAEQEATIASTAAPPTLVINPCSHDFASPAMGARRQCISSATMQVARKKTAPPSYCPATDGDNSVDNDTSNSSYNDYDECNNGDTINPMLLVENVLEEGYAPPSPTRPAMPRRMVLSTPGVRQLIARERKAHEDEVNSLVLAAREHAVVAAANPRSDGEIQIGVARSGGDDGEVSSQTDMVEGEIQIGVAPASADDGGVGMIERVIEIGVAPTADDCGADDMVEGEMQSGVAPVEAAEAVRNKTCMSVHSGRL